MWGEERYSQFILCDRLSLLIEYRLSLDQHEMCVITADDVGKGIDGPYRFFLAGRAT